MIRCDNSNLNDIGISLQRADSGSYHFLFKGTKIFWKIWKLSENYIKVHTATRWTIRHSLTLLWFADLMNVTEKVTIHRPNVSTLLSNAFIRGDLNAATRGPFVRKLLDNLHNIWWGETYHRRSAIEAINISFHVLIKKKNHNKVRNKRLNEIIMS